MALYLQRKKIEKTDQNIVLEAPLKMQINHNIFR